ncbi:MAG: Thiazole synthase [Candidatus Omnitrophica bacterium ADurb.Bin314]|jgi:thiazole synthase|nr:MAG: Thiazole synthase [Candidatus Omnitrophica bacterium ADurb.Bin314]
MTDLFRIGGRELRSRLLLGTGKFPSHDVMKKAVEASGADIVTVALRRVDATSATDNILDFIPQKCVLMTNTSGARNADEAVRIARLARASGAGDWVKIEVIRDNKYLLPENLETLKATEILVKEGFIVLPYMSPDLSMARRMADAGAAAVMPLGAPIGSNRGLRTRELVGIMVREIKVPVIVDAGLGSPSQACECLEMGCAAVLVNTAVAIAEDPVQMAAAFREAVIAGRRACLAGLPVRGQVANASSPLTGFLRNE